MHSKTYKSRKKNLIIWNGGSSMYGSRVLCTFITVSPSKTSLLTTFIPFFFLAIQDLKHGLGV